MQLETSAAPLGTVFGTCGEEFRDETGDLQIGVKKVNSLTRQVSGWCDGSKLSKLKPGAEKG